MQYLILAILLGIFVVVMFDYAEKSLKKGNKKIIYMIAVFAVALVALRFGQVILAIFAIFTPLFYRVLQYLFTHVGFLNFIYNKVTGKKNVKGTSLKISDADAREILGVAESATKEEIIQKHKALVKSLHPDKSGSEFLTKLVNQAKDKLVKNSKS